MISCLSFLRSCFLFLTKTNTKTHDYIFHFAHSSSHPLFHVAPCCCCLFPFTDSCWQLAFSWLIVRGKDLRLVNRLDTDQTPAWYCVALTREDYWLSYVFWMYSALHLKLWECMMSHDNWCVSFYCHLNHWFCSFSMLKTKKPSKLCISKHLC